MKRRTLTQSMTTIAVSAILCLSAGIMVTSCQKEVVKPDPELSKDVQPQADWAFLDFTEDFTGDFGTANDTDVEILMKAVERANLAKKDGWWEISATSPEPVKMSSAVFEYVQQIVENSNQLIIEVLQNAELVPHTRQIFERPGLIDQTPNDCFACCVDYMGNKLSYPNATRDAADAFVTRWYGDGIPSDQVLPGLQYFFGRENVSRYSMDNIIRYNNEQERVMIIYNESPGNGHAVIYRSSSNGSYVCIDPQNNDQIVAVEPGDVIDAFRVLRNH